ncbi:hypothetical protein PQO03_09855 [Lentisphaera profundi]|uniref:DUF4856 domain-containing protein n=1 Tax=Lentisphaera profundi TaxID=1658616 RepID=A0ABY7VPV7_9BACT|nr:hypothetical protein [Lentisphaera profundi]WDE96017.1 hypothetical protein PQO03_09855 [Lentisphaera profundi]
MSKFITGLFLLCLLFSCANHDGPYTQKNLSPEENTFRRSFLTTASDLHQDLYFSHQAFSSDLKLLIKEPSQEQIDATIKSLELLRTNYNKTIPFRNTHGPLDYPYLKTQHNLSQLIFAESAEFNGDENILTLLNESTPISEELLYQKHLESSNKDIYIGIPAITYSLSKNDIILSHKNEQWKTFLSRNNKILEVHIKYLLDEWSPYIAANFHHLLKTRKQEQFLGWTYTSFLINHQDVLEKIKSNTGQLSQRDLDERLNALMNLWEGSYILNDGRQYLRHGLKTLIQSPEIDNYFKTLEKSRNENNQELSLKVLTSLQNGIKREIAKSNYDRQVQSLPFIIPNPKLHALSKSRKHPKDTPFGESTKPASNNTLSNSTDFL